MKQNVSFALLPDVNGVPAEVRTNPDDATLRGAGASAGRMDGLALAALLSRRPGC